MEGLRYVGSLIVHLGSYSRINTAVWYTPGTTLVGLSGWPIVKKKKKVRQQQLRREVPVSLWASSVHRVFQRLPSEPDTTDFLLHSS
jgi:hypothetical protein